MRYLKTAYARTVPEREFRELADEILFPGSLVRGGDMRYLNRRIKYEKNNGIFDCICVYIYA